MTDALIELAKAFAFGAGFFAVCLIGFGLIRWADRDWYRERRGRNDR